MKALHFLYTGKTFCVKSRKLLISCRSQTVSQTPCNYFISTFLDLVDKCSAAAEKFLPEERLSEPCNIRGLLQPHWSLNSLHPPPLSFSTSCPSVPRRLSQPWWSWWKSAGTRTPLQGWQPCASRRRWTRFTALWRRAKSREENIWWGVNFFL